MSTASNQNHICVTCDLWGGERQAKPPYQAVFVAFESNARGKCLGGGFQNVDVSARTTCSKWRKWGPLK